ncbi:hypothetical protein AVO45_09495 [Ruegeria marisrubri]|uniref:DUF3489 domain-containing protein n=1 Tax=Ruegeria marisrubri TaxID=1685379 RepID=A0A0X3TLT2_9RHOB|nr:DUF3489 domain-containing protein [Ruegeria marisrubri]KUJ76737.1 hypothetical protein AVO45_09495 [Ruegeria marisrubri]
MPKTKHTKTDRVQALLRRPTGASLADICKTTGWQQHSARAALSMLRKKGATIERRASDKPGAPATYHLVADMDGGA